MEYKPSRLKDWALNFSTGCLKLWASGFFPAVDYPDYVLMELRHDRFGFRLPDKGEILRA